MRTRAHSETRMSNRRLATRFQPWSGPPCRLMIGRPPNSSRLVQIGDDFHVHGPLGELIHQALDEWRIFDRQRDQNLIHLPPVEHRIHVTDMANHRDAPNDGADLLRMAGDDSGDPETELAVLVDRIDDALAEITGADENDRPEVVPTASKLVQGLAEQQSRS